MLNTQKKSPNRITFITISFNFHDVFLFATFHVWEKANVKLSGVDHGVRVNETNALNDLCVFLFSKLRGSSKTVRKILLLPIRVYSVFSVSTFGMKANIRVTIQEKIRVRSNIAWFVNLPRLLCSNRLSLISYLRLTSFLISAIVGTSNLVCGISLCFFIQKYFALINAMKSGDPNIEPRDTYLIQTDISDGLTKDSHQHAHRFFPGQD